MIHAGEDETAKQDHQLRAIKAGDLHAAEIGGKLRTSAGLIPAKQVTDAIIRKVGFAQSEVLLQPPAPPFPGEKLRCESDTEVDQPVQLTGCAPPVKNGDQIWLELTSYVGNARRHG